MDLGKYGLYVGIACFVYAGISVFMLIASIGELTSYDAYEQYILSTLDLGAGVSQDGSIAPITTGSLLSNEVYSEIAYASIGLVLGLFAGLVFVSSHSRHSEDILHKSFQESVTNEDDKRVISELEKAGGELTQSELVRNTGLSKVKIHRVVSRIERFGFVEKLPYGMTNKVRLTKGREKG